MISIFYNLNFRTALNVVAATMLLAQCVFAAEYTFTSQLDNFKVEVTDSGATYNGNEVSIQPFVFIKPLFYARFEDACPSGLGKPDLTVIRKINEKVDKRVIYYDKKTISDGTNCGYISGHGLYQLPLHHNWFESKKVTIGLGNEFSIYKNNRLVVAFEKVGDKWQNKDKKFLTNWSFFEEFIAAIKDFPIDFRVHPSAVKDFSTFELRQGGRTFKFVKVGEETWAVQFPGSPWFAASGRFGIFADMSQSIWLNQNSKPLSILMDATAPADKRISAIRDLSSQWGSDLNRAMHSVMLTQGDNIDVKKEIISLLRKRPTDENFKALVDALRASDDTDYLNYLTKALRVRNPKGPIIGLDDNDAAIKSKTQIWIEWRRTLK